MAFNEARPLQRFWTLELQHFWNLQHDLDRLSRLHQLQPALEIVSGRWCVTIGSRFSRPDSRKFST